MLKGGGAPDLQDQAVRREAEPEELTVHMAQEVRQAKAQEWASACCEGCCHGGRQTSSRIRPNNVPTSPKKYALGCELRLDPSIL